MSPLRNLLRVGKIGLTLAISLPLIPFGLLGFAVWRVWLRRQPEERRMRLMQRVFHRAFGLMHGWLDVFGLLHFDSGDIHRALPEGPCVIVANHPTLTDISALPELAMVST